MRARTYGLLLLALIGIFPLALYGYLGIERSETTSIDAVREGNGHLAQVTAEAVRLHIEQQHDVLEILGMTVLESTDPTLTIAALRLDVRYEHFSDMLVYRIRDGEIARVFGTVSKPRRDEYDQLVAQAVAKPDLVVPTMVKRAKFGLTMTIVETVEFAGTLIGVIVAHYDLIGIWGVMRSVSVGDRTYARLVSEKNETIAHGSPDIRSISFRQHQDDVPKLLRAAATEDVTENFRGEEIVVAKAMVSSQTNPGACWQTMRIAVERSGDSGDSAAVLTKEPPCWQVLIEQAVDEAFAGTKAMKRDLVLVGVGVLLLVIIVGFFAGRWLVKALERLREHTRNLSVDLTSRMTFNSGLVELRALADALDDMAKKLITERDEAKRRERLTTFARVAAGLAHDLRLPIEAVRGACDTVNRLQELDAAHQFLRKVSERELPRLKRFVDDLQRLARRGAIRLEMVSVDVLALVQEVHAELSSAPKWQGVEFEVVGKADSILLDRGLIRRAVLNLAGNAADACLARGIGHCVTMEIADTDDGQAMEIRVRDTGVGISPEQLRNLENGDFESTKRSTGVGLGLSVVRQVTLAHRGRLMVDSILGQGSTFVLQLPRNPVSSEASENEIL